MKPKNSVRLDRTVGPLVYRMHKWMYRATGGVVGRKTAQGPVILLTYTGRKSGNTYTTPLLSVPDGDGWIVVASNGGRPSHPKWFLNVRDCPDVAVQDGRRRVKAVATVADAARRMELWPRVNEQYRGWEHYQTLTEREIPVVELRPVAQS